MITLFGYNISPYVAKVRAVLRWKGLPFTERDVHPLDRRELEQRSGQRLVPALDDDGQMISDSTRIVRYLDGKYPERPVLPRDPKLRARALLLEEWADEGLPRVVQPVRWLIPGNFERTFQLFRSAYPAGGLEDLKWAGVRRVIDYDQRRRYGTRTLGRPRASSILNRLAELCDVLDGALEETGWLAGPEPSVADFAAWGFLHLLDGLDGWETVKTRRRVATLIKRLGAARPDAPEAYDSEDAAQLEARRHRESKKRLPLV